MGSGAGGFVLIITLTIVVLLLGWLAALRFLEAQRLRDGSSASNRSRWPQSSASIWIRSASNARASLKFTLLVLAVLAPMAVVLLQLSPKAGQLGDVTISSGGGKILIAGGFSSSMEEFTATTELFDPATNTFAPANQTASMNSGRDGATASVLISGPNIGKVLIAGGAGAGRWR